MSPTEFELRAALRDGEGGGIDPDRVVARAEAQRRQRRSRLLSGASVAAVVAAIGIGGTALWQSGGSGGGESGGSAADVPAAGRNADSAGGAGSSIAPSSGKPYSSVLTICEDHVPHLTTGTSVPRTAAPGPIFDSSVTSISICSYGITLDQAKTVTPKGTTVTGKQAAELVDSLNSARTEPPGICPQYRTQDTQHYVLLGMDDKGKSGTPVVITLAGNPCQTFVTNGTAIRYEWSPPADIAQVLASISPKAGGVPAPGHS